ncbi:hypothetical protein EYF80_019142 [Liparis tanakae]|uniref:Uncharacterized protein n=1 Tax=Liparis tanakae TaxID=230148 RepID=A0A4Z2HZD4_9TELE|nr:hypothetical protein EYF80_019142 [Liparis tanakae]
MRRVGPSVPVSSDANCPSFTGVVLSDEDELAFPEAGLWLLSCELVGSVKASWVELESESTTTSLKGKEPNPRDRV